MASSGTQLGEGGEDRISKKRRTKGGVAISPHATVEKKKKGSDLNATWKKERTRAH